MVTFGYWVVICKYTIMFVCHRFESKADTATGLQKSVKFCTAKRPTKVVLLISTTTCCHWIMVSPKKPRILIIHIEIANFFGNSLFKSRILYSIKHTLSPISLLMITHKNQSKVKVFGNQIRLLVKKERIHQTVSITSDRFKQKIAVVSRSAFACKVRVCLLTIRTVRLRLSYVTPTRVEVVKMNRRNKMKNRKGKRKKQIENISYIKTEWQTFKSQLIYAWKYDDHNERCRS